jgi:hypothetical protein
LESFIQEKTDRKSWLTQNEKRITMKRMRVWLTILVFSLLGGLAVSAIVGTLNLPLNQIATPLVCGDNQLLQTVSTPQKTAASKNSTSKVYCVDDTTGERLSDDVSMAVTAITGAIYGLIIFSVAFLALLWNKNMRKNSFKRARKHHKISQLR